MTMETAVGESVDRAARAAVEAADDDAEYTRDLAEYATQWVLDAIRLSHAEAAVPQ